MITTIILATAFTPIKKRLEEIVERRYKKPAQPPARSAGAGSPDVLGDPVLAIEARLRAIVREELERSGRPG